MSGLSKMIKRKVPDREAPVDASDSVEPEEPQGDLVELPEQFPY